MIDQSKRALILLALIALAGCQTAPSADSSNGTTGSSTLPSDASPTPTPVKAAENRQVPTSQPATYENSEFSEPTGPLTLRQALALVVLRSPELVTASYEVRAADARRLQAGLRPNPELEIGVNQFGGTGPYRGLNSAESTLRFGQLIELGGKRQLRRNIADRDRDLANWDYEAKRLDVLLATTQAFIEVVAAQQRVALAEDAAGISQRVFDTVSERVRAGQISPLEQTRSQVVLSTNMLALERARRGLRVSRENLAAMWASRRALFTDAQGDFESLRPIPNFDQMSEKVAGNPDLARWDTERMQREETLKLAKAKNIPDPTVSVGMTRFEDTRDSALLVGLSFPLPVFGINPGGVREAEAALAQSIAAERESEIRIKTALNSSYQLLASSYSEVLSLQKDVLPAAEQAFSAAGEAYRVGKITFIEVLDAQRALLEARSSYIGSLADYHKSLAEVERLIGQPLTQNSGESK